MSKKYLVLELWPKNLNIGNFGPDFQMRISRERKEQTEIRLYFHEEQRQYFLNAPCQIATIFTPSARKSRFFRFLRKSSPVMCIDFLHEDRSNPSLTHGENRMSGKNLVLQIFEPESGAG